MLGDESRGERRACKRRILDDRDRLRLVSGRRSTECRLGDVSATGVRVIAPRRELGDLATGDAVELRCPDGGAVGADVVHLTDDAVGLRFHDSRVAAAFWYCRILGKLRSDRPPPPAC